MGCILQFLFFIFILAFIGVVRFWWTIRTLMNNVREQAKQQQDENKTYHYNNTSNNNASNSSGTTIHGSASTHKKVFDDNEGEYVEFEEISE